MSVTYPASERVMLSMVVEALLTRIPTRRRCPNCRRKRALITVTVVTPDFIVAGESLPRCLECWGVRDHG